MTENPLRDTSLRAAFACVELLRTEAYAEGRVPSGIEMLKVFKTITDAVYDANLRYADPTMQPPVMCGCDYHGDRAACNFACVCSCRFVVLRVD